MSKRLENRGHGRSAPRVTIGLLPCAILAAFLALSCSGDNDSSQPVAPSVETSWAIHLYAGPDHQRYDIGPLPELSADAASAADPAVDTAGLHTEAVITRPGIGSTDIDQTKLDTSAAWSLLWGAAVECGMRQSGTPKTQVEGYLPVVPPWSTGTWFIFSQSALTSCDAVLAAEEVLVCTADKLKEVADAIAPINWAVPVGASSGLLPGPWVIPPQADQDRFIARDLAIYTLAHLALLDGTQVAGAVGGGNSEKTCSAMYTHVIRDPAWGGTTANINPIFGASAVSSTHPLYPPSNNLLNSAAGAAKVADEHLAFEAHVLRAGGRMLHDLIRDSVYSDLAGAMRRAGRAGDPQLGRDYLWGKMGPYNSLSHAIRVLTGRWEMGSNKPDPACGGVAALDLLTKAYGPDFSARANDNQVRTTGQATAAHLMMSSGILLPPTLSGDIKSIVADQLVGSFAQQQGHVTSGTVDPVFVSSNAAKSLRNVVQSMPEADLRFGLAHSLRSYQLSSNVAESAIPIKNQAGTNPLRPGLTAVPYITPAVAAVGNVVQEGTSRGPAANDPVALASGIMEASQCNETSLNVLNSEEGTLGQITTPVTSRTVFQDAFHIAHMIQRRLVKLRQVLENATVPTDDTAEAVARAGIAEIRPWAALGRVTMFNANVSYLTFTLDGFEPKDFGVDTASDIWPQLSLVWGAPWVAECAAGLRKDCPSDFATKYVYIPNIYTSTGASANTTNRAFNGYTNTVVNVVYTNPVPEKFQLKENTWTASTGYPNEHLYMIAAKDPSPGSSHGMIVGTFAYRGSGNHLVDSLFSPMQRELLDAVIGVASGNRTHLPREGDLGASESDAYCVDGVPRDVFVPLENELTSDSDQYENSWRHYLNMAKEAAARADDLAQKTIDVGLQQDTRREAAAQQLAEICGDISALDGLQVGVDGKVTTTSPDTTLQECLGGAKRDIVYISDDQTPLDSAAAVTDLQARLGCPNSHPLCTKLSKPGAVVKTGDNLQASDTSNPNLVTTGGLGLFHPETKAQKNGCETIASAVASTHTGFDNTVFGAAVTEDWAQPLRLLTAAKVLQLRVEDQTADWTVTAGGETLMSSKAGPAWPGCLLTYMVNGQTTHCDFTNPRINLLNEMFRSENPGASCSNKRQCDFVAGAARDELNLLRWRVSGALWLLGSIAGKVPGGMFQTPIPAIAFNTAGGPITAPLPAIYDRSTFSGAGPYRLDQTNNNDDVAALGDATTIDASFKFPVGFQNELPGWYSEIYVSNTGRYYHVPSVSNAEEVTNYWGLSHFFLEDRGGSLKDSTNFASIDAQALRVIGDVFNGNSCTNPGGGNQDASPTMKMGIIAALKSNWQPNDENQVPNQHTFAGKLDYPIVAFWDGAFKSLYQDGDDFGTNGWAVNRNLPPAFIGGGAFEAFRSSGSGEDIFRASVVTKELRVRAFVNSGPPADDCAATAQLVQALGLACTASEQAGAGVLSSDVPPINSEDDIARFEAWLQRMGSDVRKTVGVLYLEQVPDAVVRSVKNGTSLQGAARGEHGDKLRAIEDALRAVSKSWEDLSYDLDKLALLVRNVRQAIAQVHLTNREKVIQIEMQRVQTLAGSIGGLARFGIDIVQLASGETPDFWGSLQKAIANAETSAIAVTQSFQLKTLEDVAGEEHSNEIVGALNDFATQATDSVHYLRNDITNIRTASSAVSKATEDLRATELKALQTAGAGLGADFVTAPDGSVATYPVNTVLRREYSGTLRRYQKALKDAKALTYIARRAIEQRIGVPLLKMTESVGPLEAPALWADDLCHLTGIDYSRLRSVGADAGSDSGAADAATDTQLTNEFADSFIGDYVAKLENFVDYYNVQYPSHDGDDTAVLSLRENLLDSKAVCTTESRNLLYYSTRLNDFVPGSVTPQNAHGWQMHPCRLTKCLEVVDGTALGPVSPPDGAMWGSATWLRDRSSTASDGGSDAGTDGGHSLDMEVDGPPGYLSQPVYLEPGDYVLSWWDQARAADGSVANVSQTPYSATIFDSYWGSIATLKQEAQAPASDAGGTWSSRQTLSFKVESSGIVHIGFAASDPSTSLGSVVLSSVQLERTTEGGGPSEYQMTDGSREVLVANCGAGSSADLRSAFQRQCDGSGFCYFELVQPFTIDSRTLNTLGNRLAGKFARGNFNYRHMTVALNLVGTGLLDCTQSGSPSCYGTNVVEYTLEHDANQVPIMDWSGNFEFFNFGLARIEHGKALAGERYITTPIGSADQGLLGQPGILKPEFRGRPIDGNYRLRIWDNPALKWSKIEDIQLVWQYRYWSRIDRQGTSP